MQLNPIYPIFHHVKGHQDEKSDWPSLFLKNSTLIAMLKNENLHHICMSQPYSTIPPTKPDIHIYRLLNRLLLNNFRMNYVMHSLNHLTLTTYKPSSSGHVCQRSPSTGASYKLVAGVSTGTGGGGSCGTDCCVLCPPAWVCQGRTRGGGFHRGGHGGPSP